MNWEERLSKWADKLEVAGEKTVDFSSAEIPDIREVLAWEFWHSVMAGSACLVGLIALVIVGYVIYRATKKADYTIGDPECGIPIMLECFVSIGLIAGIIVNTSQAVKVKVAPRVVIMDKVKEQLRK